MTYYQLVTERVCWEGPVRERAKVLLVEDSREVRDSLQYALSSYEIDVYVCENAEEALVLAARESFDYVITDYKMPGMNGVELVKRLRGLLPPLTVIIGMSGMEVSVDFLEAGANDFIRKPFVPYDVAMLIDGRDIPL